jgi:Acyl-CoA dehydrogenase, C-terminal domain
MNFESSEYQTVVRDALSRMTSAYKSTPLLHDETYLYRDELDSQISMSGFLSLMEESAGDTSAAVEFVCGIAELPYCVEVAASTFVRPVLDVELPRPLTVLQDNRPGRFAPIAKTALIEVEDDFLLVDLRAGDVDPIDTLLAYPYGRISDAARARGRALGPTLSGMVRTRHRLAIAAEISGTMEAALALTVNYVKERQQFGRPIGAFQAVQHRLASSAVLIEGSKWLTLQAAAKGTSSSAAVAATYAQDASLKVAYDLHQFTGAMGLTLEYPLHLWTYRLRALVSELGGPARQAIAAAETVWGDL